MNGIARIYIIVAGLTACTTPAAGQSSIWTSLDAPTAPKRPQRDEYHVFSPPLYGIPTPPENESFAENAKLVDEIANANTSVAFDFWLQGVSGGVFQADRGTIDWVGVHPDWDYVVHGAYSRNAEDAGNFNYAVTGHRLLTRAFASLPLTDAMREFAIGWTLRIGGGAYQIKSDVFEHNMWPKPWGRRTAYFEDVNDVEPIDSGMQYDRYLQLNKIAEEVGVHLSPALFGFDEAGPLPQFPILTERLDQSDMLDRLSREEREEKEQHEGKP